ncbi:tRNA (guanosine(37)-N1)-methyltransferase TrmD [Thermocrinis sp.]
MKFFSITIFPSLFECFCQYGMVSQAIKKGVLEVFPINLRDYAPKGRVDDYAYGGHPGMVLKPEPIFLAYEDILSKHGKPHTIIAQPWGKVLTQEDLDRLSQMESILVICGRYEGIDERVSSLADEELSLGDFVISGGELLALVILEGVARLLPGVLSDPESIRRDSFRKWMGAPTYTRPAEFRGMRVPEVLLSGNHKVIELWELWHSIKRTLEKRPYAIPKELSPLEEEILRAIERGLSFEDWIKR